MRVRRILFCAALVSSCTGRAFQVGEKPDGSDAPSSNAGGRGTNQPTASGSVGSGGMQGPPRPSSPGGQAGSGGLLAESGGQVSSGGAVGSGGALSSGGAVSSGGSASTGGAVSNGGVTANTGGSSAGGTVPMAGAPGSGGAGVPVNCTSTSSDCSHCCDQMFPTSGSQKGSSAFSLAVYGCACSTCYGYCDATLCNSGAPQPSIACLQCVKDNATAGECLAEWNQCQTDSVCSNFGMCVFGCL